VSAVRLAVAVGLLLRLAFGLGYWTDKPLTHDEREYLTLAANVAQGRGFVAELPGEAIPAAAAAPANSDWSPAAAAADGGAPSADVSRAAPQGRPAPPLRAAAPANNVQRFGRAPGYPFFLAPLTWLDADLRAGRLPAHVPAAIKIVQAILGAAGILLLAALVRGVAGDRAGVAAAWIAALFPPLVWMPAYALSEQLYSVIALACATWLGRVTDGPPAGDATTAGAADTAADATTGVTQALLLAGIAAGIGALTRPVMLFFLPLAALLLVWRAAHRGAGLRRAALFGGVAILVIGPWTVRNAVVHQRFVLIASEGGVTFWTGNHREAIGEGDLAANPHLKLRNLEFRARHAGLSEEALEPLYYREALGFIAADPLWWLGLEARKLWYTFMPFGPSYRLHAPRYFWASAVSVLVLLPAAVVGLIKAPPGTPPAALLTLAASSVLVALVFFPQERFRLPVMDPALIAAAALSASRRRNAVV
jgi:4-amino-4-deoxy-L-arabinose transferase-like glycosyltransferase